jgi:hypothetical protein
MNMAESELKILYHFYLLKCTEENMFTAWVSGSHGRKSTASSEYGMQ